MHLLHVHALDAIWDTGVRQLLHAFPKVRLFAAEQLYMFVLQHMHAHARTLDGACSVLLDTDWTQERASLAAHVDILQGHWRQGIPAGPDRSTDRGPCCQ